jgi:ribulose-5-phosphate 4-epimerase/fuculose-1-phosphate aldolase
VRRILPQQAGPSTLKTMSIPNTDPAALRDARIDLAACLRMAARIGLAEGICNHFSLMVPGRDDLFLVNPDGYAFAEARASRLLVCDFDGNVVEGDGRPEDTAFYIHARIHKMHPRARACFHTHMPYATALAITEGEPFSYAVQSQLKFLGRIAIDPTFNGLALDNAEGDRIAATIGQADVVFMRNHGVTVVGRDAATAWDDLYYLERAAEAQVKAAASGRRIIPVEPALADETARVMRSGERLRARLHLESVKRRLALTDPDFTE